MLVIAIVSVSISFQLHAFRKWPQTGDEFRNIVRSGKGRIKMESYVVDQGFNPVLSFFSSKALKCMNVKVVSKMRTRNYIETGFTIYTAKIKKTSAKSADFTLQSQSSPRGTGPKMPKDGFYALMVDFASVAGNKTKINIYGPSFGYKKIFKAVREWTEGKDRACPRLY